MYFSSTEFAVNTDNAFMYVFNSEIPVFFPAPPNVQFLLSEYCGQIYPNPKVNLSSVPVGIIVWVNELKSRMEYYRNKYDYQTIFEQVLCYFLEITTYKKATFPICKFCMSDFFLSKSKIQQAIGAKTAGSLPFLFFVVILESYPFFR